MGRADLAVFLVLLALIPGGTARPAAAAQDAGDTSFLQRARGINLSQWFWYGPADPDEIAAAYTQEELNALRTAGFTAVRLPVDLYLLLNRAQPEEPDAAMLALLDQALDRLQGADLAVIVDLHNLVPDEEGIEFGARLEQSDDFVETYLAFLRGFAAHLRDRPQLSFGLLNEPVFQDDPARWQDILERAVAAARAGAPDLTLVIGGTNWASIDGLLRLDPVADPNVVYDFHFYEPFLFTHQGAEWAEGMTAFHDIPYPSSPEAVAPLLDDYDGDERASLGWYGNERWDAARIAALIGQAAAWADRHGVRLICAEFGAYPPVAPRADRLRWLRDVRTALEAAGIGWVTWEYPWIVADTAAGLRVDPAVLEALGVGRWALGVGRYSGFRNRWPGQHGHFGIAPSRRVPF